MSDLKPTHAALSIFTDRCLALRTASLRRHLAADISAGDARTLIAVREVGADGITAVSVHLGVTQSSAHVATWRLLRRKMVEQVKQDDASSTKPQRRAFQVGTKRVPLQLTLSGHKAIEAVERAVAEWTQKVISTLSTKERESLVLMIGKSLKATQ